MHILATLSSFDSLFLRVPLPLLPWRISLALPADFLDFRRPLSSLARHVPFHLAPVITAGGPPRCCSPTGFLELYCCSFYDLPENLETGLCC